jgi:hypothetical protein
LTIGRLRFGVAAHITLRGANHEAFYYCYPCWFDRRFIALNVGVGVSVFGPQF